MGYKTTLEKFGSFYKDKHTLGGLYDPAILLRIFLHKRDETIHSHKNSHANVPNSFIHNHTKTENNQLSITNTHMVVHPYHGVEME